MKDITPLLFLFKQLCCLERVKKSETLYKNSKNPVLFYCKFYVKGGHLMQVLEMRWGYGNKVGERLVELCFEVKGKMAL